jgi:hypothetical protein
MKKLTANQRADKELKRILSDAKAKGGSYAFLSGYLETALALALVRIEEAKDREKTYKRDLKNLLLGSI